MRSRPAPRTIHREFLNEYHYFGLYGGLSVGRVKCNGVPHKLRLLDERRLGLQEFAGRIRAVYLEAILPVVPLGQTEIVQGRCYS